MKTTAKSEGMIPKAPIDIEFDPEKKQKIIERLSEEFHARLKGKQPGGDQNLEINWEKTRQL